MIYVSTGGERSRTAMETAAQYCRHGIECVELSGGVYTPNYEEDLLKLSRTAHLQVHNYFPPPKVPFVFNLASVDSDISRQSVAHVRNAIRIAVLIGRPVYSFHAGFRINPAVSELGNVLQKRKLLDRKTALNIFGERLTDLAEEARREGVSLLVENNVINPSNFNTYGEDPLLLTHPEEIASFMKQAPANVALLLDVAHLKVSANTLQFDMISAHQKLIKWIKAYHLSDNDGTADTNELVTEKSWFWGYLIRGLDYYSLEVYREPISGLIQQRALAAEMLSRTHP